MQASTKDSKRLACMVNSSASRSSKVRACTTILAPRKQVLLSVCCLGIGPVYGPALQVSTADNACILDGRLKDADGVICHEVREHKAAVPAHVP